MLKVVKRANANIQTQKLDVSWHIGKIGPQCVRVATAFLFALVCEYDVVEYVQLF